MYDTGNGIRRPKTWPGLQTEEDTYSSPPTRMEACRTIEKLEPRYITEQEFRTIESELRSTKCHILDEIAWMYSKSYES